MSSRTWRLAVIVYVAAALLAATKITWPTRMGVKFSSGLTIAALTPAGYGSVIGLRIGDRIVGVNGVKVDGDADDLDAMMNRLAAKRPQPWTFIVDRDGVKHSVTHSPEFDCNPFDLIGCGNLP